MRAGRLRSCHPLVPSRRPEASAEEFSEVQVAGAVTVPIGPSALAASTWGQARRGLVGRSLCVVGSFALKKENMFESRLALRKIQQARGC